MTDRVLTALTDAVQHHRDLESPAGGPNTREHLHNTVQYYATHYGHHPPAALLEQTHRCRHLIVDMLTDEQSETARSDLRNLAGGDLDDAPVNDP